MKFKKFYFFLKVKEKQPHCITQCENNTDIVICVQVTKVRSGDKSRLSKLPPRLAKQKEMKEKEKEQGKCIMPKIENWDNELANNIPMSNANQHNNTTEVEPKSKYPRLIVLGWSW